MKKIVIFLFLFVTSFSVKCQTPVQITNPYNFNKYVTIQGYLIVNDSMKVDSILLMNGSNKVWLSPYTISKFTSLNYTPENIANKNIANGYAGLNSSGQVPSSELPSLVISNTYVDNSEASMLTGSRNVGDLSVRTDSTITLILKQTPSSNRSNWVIILTPSNAPVQSVSGRMGNIILVPSDIGIPSLASGEFLTNNGTTLNWSNLVIANITGLSAVLAGKEPSIATGTNTQFFRGDKTFEQVDLTNSVTNVLPIVNGGTGSSSVNTALNNLLPSQSGQNGKVITSNGTNAYWGSSSSLIPNDNILHWNIAGEDYQPYSGYNPNSFYNSGLSLMYGGTMGENGYNFLTTQDSLKLNAEIQAKQNTLIAGGNIKYINGNSILGGGNLVISGGSGGDDSIKMLSIYGAGQTYQPKISLTTTGTSGASTFIGNVLNIPNYTGQTYTANDPITLSSNAFGADTARHGKGLITNTMLKSDSLAIMTAVNGKQSTLTFGTGITNTSGNITVNTSQNISTLSNLTSNGLIKTSGGTGALSIATSGTDYLTPSGSGASLTGITASQVGAVSPNDTASFLLGQTRAASTYQPKGTVTLTGSTGNMPYFSSTNTVTGTSNLNWTEPNLNGQMFTSFATGNWTLTSGWDNTNGSNTEINHNAAGTTTAILNTVTPTISVTYQLIIVCNTLTAGTFTYTFGGVISSAISATGTYTTYVTATTTGGLIFTPVTGFRGTINSISILPYNQGDLNINGYLTGTSDYNKSYLQIVPSLPVQQSSNVNGNNLNLSATNYVSGNTITTNAVNGGNINLLAGNGAGGISGSAGNVNISCGNSTANSGAGGAVTISGSVYSSYFPSQLYLSPANAISYLTLAQGNGGTSNGLKIGNINQGVGADIYLIGGTGTSLPGDNIFIQAGSSTGISQVHNGGTLTLSSGSGTPLNYTSSIGYGSNGGLISCTSGSGGYVTGNVAGTNLIGGNGANIVFTAGNGGYANGTGLTFTGGNAGNYEFLFGTGGTGLTANGLNSAFGINTSTPQPTYGTDLNTNLRLTGTQYFGGTTTSASDYSHSIGNSSGNLIIKPRVDATAAVTFQNAAGTSNPLTINTTNPSIGINATQTTVSGTSGTVVFSQPETGSSIKRVIIYFNAETGAVTYTFPVAFTHTPSTHFTDDVPLTSAVVTSKSTTSVTVTGASTTGFIELVGF